MKTNAARQLEAAGIKYELRDYEVDLNDLSAIKVASQIGLPPSQVYKTLVARSGADVVLAVIPGDCEVDLKALARVSGTRRIDLVPVAELQSLTGYIRGGVTALACKKKYPVYVDESMTSHNVVAVSAGVRGTQILIAPGDYLKATQGSSARISRLSAGPK